MYIASASNVVKFHDFPSNQPIFTYQPIGNNEDACRSLSWTKDGLWLAVVPHSGHAQIVTLKNQCKLIHTINVIPEPTCASFQTQTKRNVAVGTQDGQVLLYDVKTKSIKGRYPRTSSSITHVGYTAKDSHCYVGCGNGEVLLYSHISKSLSSTFRVPKSSTLSALKPHPQKRNYLIASSTEGIVCVWDLNVNRVKFQSNAHGAPITSVIFSPVNASLAISSALDREVYVYDIETKKRVSKVTVENSIASLDFSQDALYIAMGALNGKIYIYDTRKLQHPVHSYKAHESSVRHLLYQNCQESSRINSDHLLNVSEDVVKTESSDANITKDDSVFMEPEFQEALLSSNSDANKEALKKESASSLEGDSFLNALGVGKSFLNPTESDAIDSTNRNNRKSVHFTPTPLSRLESFKLTQKSSTPNTGAVDFKTDLSPMVSDQNPIKETGEAFTESQEIKEAIVDFKDHLSANICNKAQKTRWFVLENRSIFINRTSDMQRGMDLIKECLRERPLSDQENRMLDENKALWKMREQLDKELEEKEKLLQELQREMDELLGKSDE